MFSSQFWPTFRHDSCEIPGCSDTEFTGKNNGQKQVPRGLGPLVRSRSAGMGNSRGFCVKGSDAKYAVILPPLAPSARRGASTPLLLTRLTAPRAGATTPEHPARWRRARTWLGKGMPDSSWEPCHDCCKEVTLLPWKAGWETCACLPDVDCVGPGRGPDQTCCNSFSTGWCPRKKRGPCRWEPTFEVEHGKTRGRWGSIQPLSIRAGVAEEDEKGVSKDAPPTHTPGKKSALNTWKGPGAWSQLRARPVTSRARTFLLYGLTPSFSWISSPVGAKQWVRGGSEWKEKVKELQQPWPWCGRPALTLAGERASEEMRCFGTHSKACSPLHWALQFLNEDGVCELVAQWQFLIEEGVEMSHM